MPKGWLFFQTSAMAIIVRCTNLICCSMINHSIGNNMISMNAISQMSVENNGGDLSRRRRTPSKYAESIKQLTKMPSKNYRKDRHSDSCEEDTPGARTFTPNRPDVLTCVLPSTNRKLKLSIIIKKNQKPKLKKTLSSISIDKPKENTKEKPKNVSLLESLLLVVEQYKASEENKKQQRSPKVNEGYNGEGEVTKREVRSRKDKEQQQKYIKFYQKYRGLHERFQLLQTELIQF